MNDTPSEINQLRLIKPTKHSLIHLPIHLHTNGKENVIPALIDSGAQGNFINEQFTTICNIPTIKLKNPIPMQFANGKEQKPITHCAKIHAIIDQCTIPLSLNVTNLGNKPVILGELFLCQQNPDIDWQTQSFKWREDRYTDLLHTTLDPNSDEAVYLNHIVTNQPPLIDPSIFINVFEQWEIMDEIERNKTTTATNLA